MVRWRSESRLYVGKATICRPVHHNNLGRSNQSKKRTASIYSYCGEVKHRKGG